MATNTSQLYAKNVESLLALITGEGGDLKLDFEDEIVAGACVTHEGEIKNERAREIAEGDSGDG
jgi:H+-translocating NAD(P) transhydrogenase subunit alpha